MVIPAPPPAKLSRRGLARRHSLIQYDGATGSADFGDNMSLYQVQKLLREINRHESCRARYLEDPEAFVGGYDLTEAECRAVLDLDYGTLYGMGVHALLLRPFSLLNKVDEPRYFAALRAVRARQPAKGA
jgi:hypothetical protein